MKVVKRSEFCGGGEEKVCAKTRLLGAVDNDTVFRGRIGGLSGIWFKAFTGAALLIPDRGRTKVFGTAGDHLVHDYEKLNATIVVED